MEQQPEGGGQSLWGRAGISFSYRPGAFLDGLSMRTRSASPGSGAASPAAQESNPSHLPTSGQRDHQAGITPAFLCWSQGTRCPRLESVPQMPVHPEPPHSLSLDVGSLQRQSVKMRSCGGGRALGPIRRCPYKDKASGPDPEQIQRKEAPPGLERKIQEKAGAETQASFIDQQTGQEL